jgi:hypothetical protein
MIFSKVLLISKNVLGEKNKNNVREGLETEPEFSNFKYSKIEYFYLYHNDGDDSEIFKIFHSSAAAAAQPLGLHLYCQLLSVV